MGVEPHRNVRISPNHQATPMKWLPIVRDGGHQDFVGVHVHQPLSSCLPLRIRSCGTHENHGHHVTEIVPRLKCSAQGFQEAQSPQALPAFWGDLQGCRWTNHHPRQLQNDSFKNVWSQILIHCPCARWSITKKRGDPFWMAIQRETTWRVSVETHQEGLPFWEEAILRAVGRKPATSGASQTDSQHATNQGQPVGFSPI